MREKLIKHFRNKFEEYYTKRNECKVWSEKYEVNKELALKFLRLHDFLRQNKASYYINN